MKPKLSSVAAFSLVEAVVAVAIFALATVGTVQLFKGIKDFNRESSSQHQQTAYSIYQAQRAQLGINPSLAANPLQGTVRVSGSQGNTVSIASSGTDKRTLTLYRGLVANFEVGAAKEPVAARSTIAGKANTHAVSYQASVAGPQTGMGSSMGFGIELTGTAAPTSTSQLAAPSFNVQGDLTGASWPINNICSLPPGNPPGTFYRCTYDGSSPVLTSPLWNNNPGWMPGAFPSKVTIRAFNTDPQYSPSLPVTANFSMALSVTFSRADGRSSNLTGFTINDLSTPSSTGIILSPNVAGAVIYYTLDGSQPTTSSIRYSGVFCPAPGNFFPNAVLSVLAQSSDPRFIPSPVQQFVLTAVPVTLTAPAIVTDNSTPLSPGSVVNIANQDPNGSPRTAVNGTPSAASSAATTIPLP